MRKLSDMTSKNKKLLLYIKPVIIILAILAFYTLNYFKNISYLTSKSTSESDKILYKARYLPIYGADPICVNDKAFQNLATSLRATRYHSIDASLTRTNVIVQALINDYVSINPLHIIVNAEMKLFPDNYSITRTLKQVYLSPRKVG